ncbi:MAG TPA: cytochrome c [Gaiellaceae bacterium]|nr:cytochrome c [Gaiellaceae bacterium]
MRLLVVPAVLFVALAGATFGLAKAHLAKPGAPKASGGQVVVGDQYRGETIFQQNCAPCHGAGGKGGGVGPRLVGDQITLPIVKAQIEAGGGAMPPNLVRGQALSDVLAYVATLIAPP